MDTLPPESLPDPLYQDYMESLDALYAWLHAERADTFAGMLWERGYLVIGFTTDLERHVEECRARFIHPERVYGFPAQYTLRALEACEERLRTDPEAATMDNWSVDVRRGRVVVETEGDIAGLQRRLEAELGPMIEVVRGFGPWELV